LEILTMKFPRLILAGLVASLIASVSIAQLIIPNSIPESALQSGLGSPTFTISSGCATASALTGSSTVGSFATTATTCTPVIVPGITAPHGWVCYAVDLTHPVVFTQTATTTTSCTVTGTTTSGDTVEFKAWQF
jgi:hypothetical protein